MADQNQIFDGTKLYGDVKEAESNLDSDCRIYHLANQTGTGNATVYEVLPGVELYFNDMHMSYCSQDQTVARHVIEINHCRGGRYECAFGENSLCYLAAGDLSISSVMKRKSFSSFPLRHYHGITILIALDKISSETQRLMEFFNIGLDRIRSYICEGNRCCIMRANPSIEHIFSELYQVSGQGKPGYMKIKTLELFLFLSNLDQAENIHHTDYYNQNQVKLIKEVAACITKDLTKHYTIEQLSQMFKISQTSLKKTFRGVYGASVYSYLRTYRLQTAQKMLMETMESVTAIANNIGYENPNKFTSAFKDAYGVTPTDFRKGTSLDRELSVWSGAGI